MVVRIGVAVYTGGLMCAGGAKTIMEDMNNASFTSAAQGAHAGADTSAHHRPALGGALRAIRIFAGAAVSVVLMGEAADKRAVRAI